MSILDDAVPVDDVPKKLMTVLWGPPGVGKTIAAVRSSNNTLILTDENSHVSVSQFPEYAKTAKVIPCKSYDYATGVLRELYQGNHEYDHLLVDTFDGLIRQKLKEQRESVPFKRGHDDINSLEDYNLLNNHMFDFISRLVKLPVSVTLTSHDRIPDPQSYGKGDRLLRPAIPFRVFECLNGYANVVGYMTVRKDERRVIAVRATDTFEAKNHLKMAAVVSDDEFVKTIRNWKGI
jgi:hypothetical protein